MIAYCVTVYNEIEEIKKLLGILKEAKAVDDEIVVIHTYREENEKLSSTHTEIEKICKTYSSIYHNFYFQNNFADLKNFMNSKASPAQKYIINFDADETMAPEMLKALRSFLTTSDIELLYLPRVNIVEGITQNDIDNWSWKINEHGWINWPDYQPRIYKNNPKIQWVSKVHEYLVGYSSNAAIEPDGNIYITHTKTIDKQRKQNNFYRKL